MNMFALWKRAFAGVRSGAFARHIVLSLLVAMPLFAGCVNISGKHEPPDVEAARYDDASIKTSITSQLLKIDASKANDVNVHCFNGHVFLIGEADEAFREKAVDEAEAAAGVVHVTTHWFPTGTASTADDAAVENAIEAGKVFSDDIDSRRVAVDVWGGNVVLTGIVSRQAEIDRAMRTIRAIDGVKRVTSYLTKK
jgi:hyperosmotically inducible protein